MKGFAFEDPSSDGTHAPDPRGISATLASAPWLMTSTAGLGLMTRGTSRLYRPLRSSGDGKGNEIHRSRAGGYEGMDGEIKGAAASVCYNKKTYFPFYLRRKVALGL